MKYRPIKVGQLFSADNIGQLLSVVCHAHKFYKWHCQGWAQGSFVEAEAKAERSRQRRGKAAMSFSISISHKFIYARRTQASSLTRSSADADNRLDSFSGQSRSTNMVPFHMLHIVSYCAIVTLSLRRAVITIFVFKKFHDLEMGVKGHSRSLRVISFDRLCMVSY